MSHVTGTVQVLGAPLTIGPASGAPSTSPNVWAVDFPHTLAPGGTKFVMLHFQNVNLPGTNRLEVDLGYDTDVFTSADGGTFWTRPVNIQAFASGNVPVRYVAVGAPAGSAQLDRYGRGERHNGAPGHPSFSNSDPFLPDPVFTEPTYDPFWYCADPPNWHNARCVADGDIRAQVAKSVGMIVTIHPPGHGIVSEYVSTCSVTLVDADKVVSAGHCHSPEEAITSSVIFGYETDCAGNRLAGYAPRFHKVRRALQFRWDSGFDYSLLELKTSPAGIAPLQMRPDLPGLGEQVFGVHYPNGAVKKVSPPASSFAGVVASGTMGIRVDSTLHVSGGSSGSGLFDTAGRIVGVCADGDPCRGTSLRYFPTATILTAIAPTPPPPVTRDVMLVIDRSGSMEESDGNGRRKMDAAKDAVSLFVQLIRSATGNRAGLVSFSTTAGAPTFNIRGVTETDKNLLIGTAPFAGGLVGGLTPGGATSIGEGLDAARAQFPMPGANPRSILLLTDGLQNRPRSIAEVEPALAGIDVHAIGLGSDINLDGAILSGLAASHGGQYTRASSGLALLKFFSQAFGNIFEAGVLLDPEFALRENENGRPLPFRVCGEERITIIAGWDRTDARLIVRLRTPGGSVITAATSGTENSNGRNWTYLRVPLPQGGERDGLWHVEIVRPGGGGEFPPPAPALRYFVNVIPAGGPRLLRTPDPSFVYTGDTISPLLSLRFADGSWPHHAEMELIVQRPDRGLGELVSAAGLGAALAIAGDEIPARQATLRAIEQAAGQPAIKYVTEQFTLRDDAANTRGSFESEGSAGLKLVDFLRVEGTYSFHAKASYGECQGSRELMWTVHADVGIDSGRTDVQLDPLGTKPDGTVCQRMTFTPRDKYGNRFGPGRAAGMAVTASAGSTLTSAVRDLKNGAYQVDLCWDPASVDAPGIMVGQPGRPAVAVGSSDVRLFIYSALFLCGEQKADCCSCAPVRPGRYATAITIHNSTDRDAPVIKRVIPLVLSGAVRGREPNFARVTAVDRILLPAHTATMDDCCRLQELLLGAPAGGDVPFTTGVLEIISTVELSVSATYTNAAGALEVEAILPKPLLR